MPFAVFFIFMLLKKTIFIIAILFFDHAAQHIGS